MVLSQLCYTLNTQSPHPAQPRRRALAQRSCGTEVARRRSKNVGARGGSAAGPSLYASCLPCCAVARARCRAPRHRTQPRKHAAAGSKFQKFSTLQQSSPAQEKLGKDQTNNETRYRIRLQVTICWLPRQNRPDAPLALIEARNQAAPPRPICSTLPPALHVQRIRWQNLSGNVF